LIAGAILITIVLVRLFVGKQVLATDDDFSRYHNRTFQCIKVVDGDTIDIDIPDLKDNREDRQPRAYTRIRMWGIDTPERSHHGRRAMYYGYEATEFASKLMVGKQVRLELVETKTRGYYGRLLAYVYLPDGRLYNRLAVKAGCAYADWRWAHPLRDEFLALERRARANLAGLWRRVGPDQLPKWYPPSRLARFWQSRSERRTDLPATMPHPAGK